MSAGTAVVVALAVILAFSIMGGGSRPGGEIFLQTASAAGRDPFTPSVATDTRDAEAPSGPNTSRIGSRTVAVSGAHPGLYGGTQNVASCDVEKQIAYLVENESKGSAFAGALRIPKAEVPAYLRSLTPVRLTWDTRVTNHGYRDGRATEYQAVLQAGTAVLVDDRGVPRVRCACGNPLAPAVAVQGEQEYSGEKWASFRSSTIVAVVPAPKPMKAVTMFDPDAKAWFERPNGDAQGRSDHRIPAPKGQPPDAAYPVLPEPSEDSSDVFPEGEPEGEDKGTQDGGTDEDKEKGKDEKKEKEDDQQKDDEPSRKDEETGKPSDEEEKKDEERKKGEETGKPSDEEEKKDEERKKGEETGKPSDEEEKKDEERKKDEKKKEQPVAPDSEEPPSPDQPEKPVAPETEREQPPQEQDQPVPPEQPQPPAPEEPAEPQQPEQSEQQLPESPPAEQPKQPDQQEQPQQPAEEQPQQEPQHS
ncbi:DUF6777 domain-containing protein [Streptomyces sp. WMMC940]|uniref:DUF6777 domain-containing protein n=1 Tax=Streptomyces sp. WMMC940 TaxID=3015153 RepID=UPI0022B60319|nr:DUF6777 domain-containing protein [Streptomyces sp. WMMC940]MCZ7459365.1 primosomal protein [Streptomyces sp. WMMC940]